MIRIILLIVALLGFCAPAFAYGGHAAIPSGLFYVSTSGNDSTGNGSLAAPYATPGKAQTAARSLLLGGLCPIVEFEGGTTEAAASVYALGTALSLTTSDSGSPGCVAMWKPVDGQYAAFSGGVQITGWSLCTTADSICNSGSNGVYEASAGSLTPVDQLYVNGIRYFEAHGPTYPSGWSLSSTTLTAPNSAIASYGNLTDVMIYENCAFCEAEVPVASATGTTVTPDSFAQTNFWNAVSCCSDGSGVAYVYEVVNAYELLTAADCPDGCFYWNQSTTTIYVLPASGVNISTAQVIAPQIGPSLITGNGTSYIELHRLIVENVAMTQFDQGHGYQAAFVDALCPVYPTVCNESSTDDAAFPTMPAAIDFNTYGTGIVLDHVLVTHAAGECVWFEHGERSITVSGSILSDCGAGALRVGDRYDAAQSTPGLQTANVSVTNTQFGPAQQFLLMPTTAAPYGRNETWANDEYTGTQPYVSAHMGWNGLNLATPGYNTNNLFANNKVDSACEGGNTHALSDCGILHSGGGVGWTWTGNYLESAGHSAGVPIVGFYIDNVTTGETFGGSSAALGNVVDTVGGVGPDAMFHTNPSSSTGNTLDYNCASSALGSSLDSDTTTVSNTTTFTSGSPPAACQNIINAAGIQSGVTPGP